MMKEEEESGGGEGGGDDDFKWHRKKKLANDALKGVPPSLLVRTKAAEAALLANSESGTTFVTEEDYSPSFSNEVGGTEEADGAPFSRYCGVTNSLFPTVAVARAGTRLSLAVSSVEEVCAVSPLNVCPQLLFALN